MGAVFRPRYRVAVVGSGMAGLVTAYLLSQDREQRYEVEVFEIVRARANYLAALDYF